MACSERTLEKFLQNLTYEKASKPDSLYKKPHTALVLSDNEVIDTVAAYMKKAAHGDLRNVNYPVIPES
ncbi:hypothetical protein Q4R24_08170 [Morganella morganii]